MKTMKIEPAYAAAAAVIAGCAAIAAKGPAGEAVIIISAIAASALAGKGRDTIKTAFILIKISTLIFLLQLFSVSTGQILLSAGPLHITTGGLYAACFLTMRLLAASLPLAAVLSSVRCGELADSLSSCCRLPYKYAYAFAASMRFIPMLGSEMAQVVEAQKARGVEFESGGPIRKLMKLAPLTLPLLLSALRRTDAQATAAQLRGFELRTGKSRFRRSRPGMKEAALIAATTAISTAAVVL